MVARGAIDVAPLKNDRHTVEWCREGALGVLSLDILEEPEHDEENMRACLFYGLSAVSLESPTSACKFLREEEHLKAIGMPRLVLDRLGSGHRQSRLRVHRPVERRFNAKVRRTIAWVRLGGLAIDLRPVLPVRERNVLESKHLFVVNEAVIDRVQWSVAACGSGVAPR